MCAVESILLCYRSWDWKPPGPSGKRWILMAYTIVSLPGFEGSPDTQTRIRKAKGNTETSTRSASIAPTPSAQEQLLASTARVRPREIAHRMNETTARGQPRAPDATLSRPWSPVGLLDEYSAAHLLVCWRVGSARSTALSSDEEASMAPLTSAHVLGNTAQELMSRAADTTLSA